MWRPFANPPLPLESRLRFRRIADTLHRRDNPCGEEFSRSVAAIAGQSSQLAKARRRGVAATARRRFLRDIGSHPPPGFDVRRFTLERCVRAPVGRDASLGVVAGVGTASFATWRACRHLRPKPGSNDRYWWRRGVLRIRDLLQGHVGVRYTTWIVDPIEYGRVRPESAGRGLRRLRSPAAAAHHVRG